MEPGSWCVSVILFAMAFFFAMTETSLYEYAETKFLEMLDDRDRRARARLYLEREHLMRFASALLGGLACVVLGIVIATRFANPVGVLATAAAVAVAFLLGRMLPRALGRRFPEHILRFTLPALYGLSWAFLPFAAAVQAVMDRLAGDHKHEHRVDPSDFEHEIMSAVSEGQKEGVIGHQAKEMIEGVLDFRDADVSEIMTPRTEMSAIDASSSPEQARLLAVADGHSRFPVYEETVDNIVGVLYVKDLLKHLTESGWDGVTVRDCMRPPTFVPETKHIADLLRELRRARVHIAIVLDEYGGTSGLVTVEDIIEEIVGEIEDEYDLSNGVTLRLIDPDSAEVDARVHIDDLNDALEIDLPDEGDFDTVGGFVFTVLGRVPKVGEHFVHGDVEFNVMDADQRRVNRVKVKVLRKRGD